MAAVAWAHSVTVRDPMTFRAGDLVQMYVHEYRIYYGTIRDVDDEGVDIEWANGNVNRRVFEPTAANSTHGLTVIGREGSLLTRA